ncbi:hypothetical protein [Methylomonas sp. MgM2]
MDAADEFRAELYETLAEQNALPPKRNTVIDLERDAVKPVGDTAPHINKAQPSAPPKNPIAGMHLIGAKPDQEPVKTWATGVAVHEDDLPELVAMNALYCHALVGGKNVIVGRRFCQVQGIVLTFESPAEFKKKFLHEKFINGKNRG